MDKFDLEKRLIDFSVLIIEMVNDMTTSTPVSAQPEPARSGD